MLPSAPWSARSLRLGGVPVGSPRNCEGSPRTSWDLVFHRIYLGFPRIVLDFDFGFDLDLDLALIWI